MPSSPWTAREGGSPAEDPSLAALLAGRGLPADADAGLRPVADVLTALTARPVGSDLAGLDAARAEYRRRVAVPVRLRRSTRWRSAGLVSRLGVKAGTAAAIVAMGVGGAAVAYAGALPTSWQQFAHRAIGAPARAVGHDLRRAPATGGVAGPVRGVPARHPVRHAPSAEPSAAYGSGRRARPWPHVRPGFVRPYRRREEPPGAPAESRRQPPFSRDLVRRPAQPQPIALPERPAQPQPSAPAGQNAPAAVPVLPPQAQPAAVPVLPAQVQSAAVPEQPVQAQPAAVPEQPVQAQSAAVPEQPVQAQPAAVTEQTAQAQPSTPTGRPARADASGATGQPAQTEPTAGTGPSVSNAGSVSGVS